MSHYREKLRSALQLTSDQGYAVPNFAETDGEILTQAHGFQMASALKKEYGTLRPEDLAFQCANIHWRMKQVVEHIIDAPVLLTVGSVSFKGMSLCSVTSARPGEMRRTGNFHVWWSLTSGEIIDLTLMCSLHFKYNLPLELVQPLAGKPERMSSTTWEPFLAGDDLTRAILAGSP